MAAIGRTIHHLRLCVSVHLAALTAAADASAAVEVVRSETFRLARGLKDAELQQLCEATCQQLLQREELQEQCLELVLGELQEAQDAQLGFSHLRLLSSQELSLAPEQQAIVAQHLRPLCETAAAAEPCRALSVALGVLQLLPDEDVEWLVEKSAQLARRGQGLALLQAFAKCPEIFWRCFEGRLGMWDRTFQEAEVQVLAEVLLALWPGPAAGAALAECVGPRLWELGGLRVALPQRAQLRARLAAMEVSLPVPAAAGAAALRSSLSALGGDSLAALLRALRSVSPGTAGSFSDFLSTMLSASPGAVPGNLKTLWLLLRAAAFFVSHRLKSPFGSASESLQLLDTMIVESSGKVAQKVAEALARTSPSPDLADCSFCPLACVQVVFMLEQLILLAQEPVHVQLPPAEFATPSANQFFDANRKVCFEWFQRMRGPLQQTLSRFGSPGAFFANGARLAAAKLVEELPALGEQPLSEYVLLAAHGRKEEVRGPVLSMRDRAPWLPALEALEPPGRTAGPVQILTDKSAVPHKAMEVLEQTLASLLSSALQMKDVGRCRGILALLCQLAWAASLSVGFVVSFQEPLILAAERRHEEANLLFASRHEDSRQDSKTAPLGSSRAMRALVARAWLDSAVAARDEGAVEQWLEQHAEGGVVSKAVVAFARAYDHLLKQELLACQQAVQEAKSASSSEWAAASERTERATPATASDRIGSLSRWGDMHSLLLVETAVDHKLGSPSPGAQARNFIQAELAARCQVEPFLTAQVYQPCELHLELLEALEGRLAPSRGVLRTAASFELLEACGAAYPMDELLEGCLQERSFNLAERVLDTQPAACSALFRARVLLGRGRHAEGLQVLDTALSTSFDLLLTSPAATTDIARLSSQLLDAPALAAAGPLQRLGAQLAEHTGAGTGLFSAEVVEKWKAGLQLNTVPVMLEQRLNPYFLGQLHSMTCQLCPEDAQLWGQYGDWLFAQSHPDSYVDLALQRALPEFGNASPAELQLKRRCVQALRRKRQEPMSLQWLQKRSKVAQCKLWQDLGVEAQERIAQQLGLLEAWFASLRPAAQQEMQEAYERHLALSAAPASPLAMKRVLRLLRVGGGEGLELRMLGPVLPQILAYMKSPDSNLAEVAAGLFSRLAANAHLVLLPALAGEDPNPQPSGTHGAVRPSARDLVRQQHPEKLRRAERFARALNAMAIPVDEVCAKILQFAETFLVTKALDEVPDCGQLLLGHFSALLSALDAAAGEDRHGRGAVEAEVLGIMGCVPDLKTSFARKFLAAFLPQLRRMVFVHKPKLEKQPANGLELQRSLLQHLQLLQRCCHSSRASVPLAELAPELVQMLQSEAEEEPIVLPIETQVTADHNFCSGNFMRLHAASQNVQLLSTKTKPKKLSFEAEDGSWHSFLLKGRDDLRLDGRIMQLLRMANAVAQTRFGAAAVPRCRGYDVVPIAPRAGLIRWVSAVPLFVIHTQRRQVAQKEDTRKVTSADLWHQKIQMHLRALDSDVSQPRRQWPPEALRRTFEEMQADSPRDLISRELLLSSLHPGQHFMRQNAYTLSCAFSSVLGHLIGLGDRHLDNVLLDLTTGEVVHVDYSICFDRGQRLRVPERVPFRLTRCMVHALGPLGVGGPFVHTMEQGLCLMTEWRELIISLAEPCFLLEPVNDWICPVVTPFHWSQVRKAKPEEPEEHVEIVEVPILHLLKREVPEPPPQPREVEWPALGALPPPPPTDPPPPPKKSESSSASSTQAREDEDNEGPRTPRSPRTGSGRQDEECLLAQDREEMDETLGTVYNGLRNRRVQRAGSEAQDAENQAADAEAEDDDEDDYEQEGSNDQNDQPAASGAENLEPRKAPRCPAATYALSSIHRKIPARSSSLEAEALIAQATNPEELAQMYEGWTSWI
ncbi:unnamed protein product [Effrenium voratum]|uniref:non-specific serine/threonine protein kinase n=1 Tax=Effrenium voratum TaxID=2562239 RepID=A0AA36MVJ5_9DINO|nr:unnamed protein product [Effrenium voratum]